MKFFDVIIVRKDELRKKWWHRLANVLIYGSTILLGIVISYLFFTEGADGWRKYSYVAYSFEPNYESAKGKEMDCLFISSRYSKPFIRCGDIKDSTDFLTRDAASKGKDFAKWKLDHPDISDDSIMNGYIESGDLENIKVKRTTTIQHVTIFRDFGIAVLIILGWFIVWESIIYRALVYIIYG